MNIFFFISTLQTLKKNKFLCVDKYSEEYFDFKCNKGKPPSRAEWYTICGTDYTNHAEYITIVNTFCAIGLFWFWQLLCRSGNLPRVFKSAKQSRDKQHMD